MSIAVELQELAERVAEYGPVAFLITTGDDGAPHLVSTAVALTDDGALVVRIGRTTTANATARPRVTMMWSPVAARPEYCLIVDGNATVDPDGCRIQPDRAVLHRMADATGDGPGCITVLDAR
ncbi:MAG: pyridoxamine 5'-phosphate oxidase family protein [Acidimicrobiales bacterium]